MTDRNGWPRILVVEDDESQILALTVGLGREGLAVSAVRDPVEALGLVAELDPDVVLLDVVLPKMSGIEVCRELRRRGLAVPIIIVSSKSDEVDVVVGIEVGADDYVVKPYRMRELVARISALLRRRPRDHHDGDAPCAPAVAPTGVLGVGDVVLDPGRHEVFVRSARVELPLREFQVLRELLEHAGHVVTREDLLERIWGVDYEGDPRIVATLVGRLRARIEVDPDEPVHITTIRGVGYRFNDR